MKLCMILSTAAALALPLTAPSPLSAQSQPAADPTDAGKAVFKRANCMGCHKWHGNGGGGYGGDALSLRRTELTREQIIETVHCGRPGTGMPYFDRGAYDSVKCYGMNRQDVGKEVPPEGGVFLRETDIDAAADYVIAHIKGKGDPSLEECASFFSQTSKVCDIYKKAEQAPSGTPTR